MLKYNQTLADLEQTTCQPGRLEWIGVRSARRMTMTAVEQALLQEGRGLSGDHQATSRYTGGKRQVTLVQAEYLPLIAALCQRETIDPSLLRRNLVIGGINLHILKDKRFRIGNALLEGTGYCHPCSRMEENLGPGGYNAVKGHGGITARIFKGGVIRLGDRIELIGKE